LTDFGEVHSDEAPRADWWSKGTDRKEKADAAHAAALAEAEYQRGLTEGHAAAQQEFEAEIASLRAQAEQERQAARTLWLEEEAARLAEGVRAGMSEIEAKMARSVTSVIAPFVAERVREQALGELAAALSLLSAEGASVSLRVRGAEDLIAALQPALSGLNVVEMEIVEGAADVRIVADETTIESRIGQWLANIRECMS
jgi:limonene-1,2-epoxide hydrolase